MHALLVPPMPVIGGVRLTTLAMGVLILSVYLARRRPILAVLAFGAWLFGYEIAWQWTTNLVHHGSITNAVVQTVGTAAWPAAAYFAGIRPRRALLAATAALWLVWVVLGFPWNPKTPGAAVSLSAEILNVATKTTWGLAYLFAVLPERRRLALPRQLAALASVVR